MQSSFLSGLGLVCLLSFAQPVLAAPEQSSNPETNSNSTLKGGVVEIAVTLNNLRDARLSISRVRKAAANLYDEVTRQQVTMNYNPNLVGTTLITVATPSFSGQFLAPRKKWVNASMAEIAPIISLFKEDVDAAIESNRHTNVSESARKQLDPLREDAFSTVKSSFDVFKNLEGLTAGTGYDNNAIASAAKNLDAQMKQLDRSFKKGVSILQKEEKSSGKAKA